MKVLTMQKHRMTRVSETFYSESRPQDKEGGQLYSHILFYYAIMLICTQMHFLNSQIFGSD